MASVMKLSSFIYELSFFDGLILLVELSFLDGDFGGEEFLLDLNDVPVKFILSDLVGDGMESAWAYCNAFSFKARPLAKASFILFAFPA